MLKEDGRGSGETRSLAGTGAGGGRILACARCRHPIARPTARVEVDGAHEHTFDNPEGDRFRIGCFAEAGGLLHVGPSSLEWTWFAGYRWQVAVCAGCRLQLGWLYRRAEHRFHGLILDALVEIEPD